MTDHADQRASERSKNDKYSKDRRYAYFEDGLSVVEEEPGVETSDPEAQEVEDSIVGVSISQTQSHLKSPTTPRVEKVAAMEQQLDFFDRRLDILETDETSDHEHIIHDVPHANRTAERPSTPITNVIRPSDESVSPAKLPSPWRAGPKISERNEDTSRVLESAFRKRSSSGSEKGFRLPLHLPSLPRFFGSSTSSNDTPKSSNRMQTSQTETSQVFPRFDGAAWSREWDGLVTRAKDQWNGEQASRSELSLTLKGSPSGDVTSTESLRDSEARPHLELRRASSDQSLHLARTLSKASSLGDDSRFENVNEQINSRVKAIRDSWQDSNLRRTLPNLSLPKGPSIFSSSKVDLESQIASHDGSQRSLASNGNSSSTPISRKPLIGTTQNAAQAFPHFTRALENLTGDIVILGGYRGSILREAQPPHRRVWLPILKAGLNLRKVNLEVDFENEDRSTETVVPDGMLTHIGPVDISRRLLKRLRNSENARQGRLRVHDYGYDWRLSPHKLARQLTAFLESLSCNSTETSPDQRGAIVVAHSLGGLITRYAVNTSPQLFGGVLYAGVPDTCVNILGPLRFGDQVLMSSRVLTAQVNLSIRTSLVLLPLDGKCFIDIDTNEEYPVDFHNVNDWIKYRFSPCIDPPLAAKSAPPVKSTGIISTVSSMIPDSLVNSLNNRRDSAAQRNGNTMTQDSASTKGKAEHADAHTEGMPSSGMAPQMGPSSTNNHTENSSANTRTDDSSGGITISRQAAIAYLQKTLPEIKRFREELAHDPALQERNVYPPVAVMYGKTEPTVYGARVRGRDGIARADAYSNLSFRSGDGVVLSRSAQLPKGYKAVRGGVVASERGHVTLLSDLEAVGRCLNALARARKEGIGKGLRT